MKWNEIRWCTELNEMMGTKRIGNQKESVILYCSNVSNSDSEWAPHPQIIALIAHAWVRIGAQKDCPEPKRTGTQKDWNPNGSGKNKIPRKWNEMKWNDGVKGAKFTDWKPKALETQKQPVVLYRPNLTNSDWKWAPHGDPGILALVTNECGLRAVVCAFGRGLGRFV